MKHRCGKITANGALRAGELFCVVLFILLFATCSSLPVLPVPKTENDTLLVFLTGKKMDPNSDFMCYWELQLDDGKKPVTIRPWEKYVVVSGLAPGDHRSLTLTFVPYSHSANWVLPSTAKPVTRPFAFPFTLKPGTCTIFPIRFVYKSESDMIHGTGRFDFLPQMLTAEDLRKAYEEMKIIKNFKEWKIDDSAAD